MTFYDRMRDLLSELADERGEWAGIPTLLQGERLIVEPTYPFAKLSEFGRPDETPNEEGWRVHNRFWSTKKGRDVLVMHRGPKDRPEVQWGTDTQVHHLDNDIRTLGCADAWGLEQEATAMGLLRSLVKPRAFRQYVMTGMFLESSKRSGLTYLFRRLRPTVVLSPRVDNESRGMKILACLCLHPIAFYAESWAGAMCPTDDVVAHLMLMRGDEAMYWRRANQHPPHRPEAGL